MTTVTELAAAAEVRGTVVYDFTIPARASWSRVVKKGQTARIIDVGGNQSGDCLLYNAHDPAERYSAQDTITAQRNIFLTTGSVLMSNEGNPMMTVTADTLGRHDTSGGRVRVSRIRCGMGSLRSISMLAWRILFMNWGSTILGSGTWFRISTGS